MPVRPRRLQERVDYLIRRRRFVANEAAAFVREHYRRHHRLPPGYVLALLPPSTVRRIRFLSDLRAAFNTFSRVLLAGCIDRRKR